MIRSKYFKYLSLAVIFLAIAACSRNPVTGKKEAFLMSEENEVALGAQNDPAVVASFGLYEDETLQKFIDAKGQQMARISHRPNLKFEFKVLNSAVVNAFALPGGYVYFTRGIMAHFNNEAEFAGVLGHEIGHVTGRHGAIQQRNQIASQLGLIAGLVFVKELGQFAQQLQQGMQLLLLKNSRDHESQSDELGVLYSTQIGYNANEMANFFQTISRLSGGASQSIPDFLSTHPNPIDRYNRVHRLADLAQNQFGKTESELKVNRDGYLRMIEGIVYGNDPREGYVENNVFYHPELKFEYPIPNNWKVNNSPQQVQMAPESGEALIILTLAAGSTLDEAAAKMVEQFQLTVEDQRNTTINSFPARVIKSKQVNQQTGAAIELLSTLIRDGDLIYVFHGLSTPEKFAIYRSNFERTMNNFKRLTDQSKINVTPDRIRVKQVQQNGTLESVLRTYGTPADRIDELAIVNGMERTTPVTKGMLIKTIGK